MTFHSLALLLLFLQTEGVGTPPTTSEAVASPNGQVVATLTLDSQLTGPRLVIALADKELVRCDDLGLDFVDGPFFGAGLELIERRASERPVTYEHAFGKRRALVDRHHAVVWSLRESARLGRAAELHVRVHDDGVSYRWRFLTWPGAGTAQVAGERTSYLLDGDPRAFPLYREHYQTSHEGPYARTRLSGLAPRRLIDLPLLFTHDDGRCLAFTEADVRGFPHAYLERPEDDVALLEPRLSPRIDDPRVAANVDVPFQTPWRVWIVGDSIATLLESDILLHLCEPSRVKDTSWIVPGKQTWHWWNGTVVNASDAGGLDFATMREYIDFCARSGIRYHAVNGQQVPWYTQSRKSVLPSPDANVLEPRPELKWEELLAHASERDVALRLWAHWEALEPKLEEAFALYESWGVTGLMVDFLNRDDQEMVQFCERVLELAARHRLTVTFHGSFKPTGLQRTFPHLMNQEGSGNLEVLKWSDRCDPDHDLIVPFTRGLAGPIDYHLGGFRAVHRDDFVPRNVRPNTLGTRARALAYYVVLENPLPMVADYPAAYGDQPGFDFLVDVPTTWDESRVLSAEIGEHIAWARRKGQRWYVGAITDWSPRELVLPLAFLGPGEHEVRLMADSEDPESDPNVLVESRRSVTMEDTLRLSLAIGGGAVAIFE